MNFKRISGLCLLVVGLSLPTVMAQEGGPSELLPPDAEAGHCYARVFVPPAYRTETKSVLKHEAYEEIEIIPASFEWTAETVKVKEASHSLEVIPATYEWVTETIEVRPASKKVVEVPAKFETVTERMLDRPAHTVWKRGEGPVQKVNNATGEIMCLVEVPATYKTVTKRVLTSPATHREIEVPAEYKTIRRQAMTTPPSTRKVEIPADYETVRVQKMVSPPKVQKMTSPAEYQTVSNTVKVSDGHMDWQEILCQTNTTSKVVRSIQSALRNAGQYNGAIDGVMGPQTMNAVRSFQQSKGMPAGFLTMDTLKRLGVRP